VLIEKAGISVDQQVTELGTTLGRALLMPTKIYVSACMALKKSLKIKGMAHITGGGITGNLPRIFQPGISAEIKMGSWPVPPVFRMIERHGNVPFEEMYKTFNMGIGYIIVVAEKDADAAITTLSSTGSDAYRIGSITKGDKHGVVYL